MRRLKDNFTELLKEAVHYRGNNGEHTPPTNERVATQLTWNQRNLKKIKNIKNLGNDEVKAEIKVHKCIANKWTEILTMPKL